MPACLGADNEARRYGQAKVDHLGEVGTLAAEEVLHVLIALGEVIDKLRHCTLSLRCRGPGSAGLDGGQTPETPPDCWAPGGSVITAFSALVHDSTEPGDLHAARTRRCTRRYPDGGPRERGPARACASPGEEWSLPMAEPIVIGLLHPGEMGVALGRCLIGRGHQVLWAAVGRGRQTAGRALASGLSDVGTAAAVARRADVIVSVCPPHAALHVARSVPGFSGTYVDANALSPQTACQVAEIVTAAGSVRGLFDGTALEARIAGGGPQCASAVKMAYAAWTKGSAALLLAAREVAESEGVGDMLTAE